MIELVDGIPVVRNPGDTLFEFATSHLAEWISGSPPENSPAGLYALAMRPHMRPRYQLAEVVSVTEFNVNLGDYSIPKSGIAAFRPFAPIRASMPQKPEFVRVYKAADPHQCGWGFLEGEWWAVLPDDTEMRTAIRRCPRHEWAAHTAADYVRPKPTQTIGGKR